MGICLDTEQNNGSQMFEGQNNREAWNQERHQDLRYINTPPDGEFPMHNSGAVQFEIPKVPVIFVLGGPGSGKVTHCDNLMQEKRGIAHINMTDLLQQYAIGNDMQDFSQLSSKTVTEVLMLEMKMAPTAKTYLVSGYPRNMRDVVEYSEKIQVVSGVILVSWRQKVLERQIDYGAKLGQVVLSLARMELNNFYKNVMPVADYFDQSGMLIAINGERHPGEVYKDFHAAVMRILGMQDNPPMLANGPAVTIPNEIEPVVDQTTHNNIRHAVSPPIAGSSTVGTTGSKVISPSQASTEIITVKAHDTPLSISPVKPGWPPVIWVIGGPGSNKAALCTKAAQQKPGWVHVSLGKLLRTAADNADLKSNGDERIIKQSISVGEMVPPNVVMQILETHMAANISKNGVIIDGYPRDLKQVDEFETKFKQKPVLILLDCSKLQLGRGRLDDSVAAFRRRLELFRELSLPMLKSLDSDDRLTIVDGDTDAAEVQEDFNAVIREQMDKSSRQGGNDIPNSLNQRRGTFVEDLEAVTGLATISSRVQNNIPNGIANGVAHGSNFIPNGGTNASNPSLTNRFLRGHAVSEKGSNIANGGLVANGYGPSSIPNGIPAKNQVGDMYTNYSNQKRENIKNMYNGIDGYSNHI